MVVENHQHEPETLTLQLSEASDPVATPHLAGLGPAGYDEFALI